MDYMGERWWLFSDSLLLHEGSRSSSYLSAREPSKVSGRWVGLGGEREAGRTGPKGGEKLPPKNREMRRAAGQRRAGTSAV